MKVERTEKFFWILRSIFDNLTNNKEYCLQKCCLVSAEMTRWRRSTCGSSHLITEHRLPAEAHGFPFKSLLAEGNSVRNGFSRLISASRSQPRAGEKKNENIMHSTCKQSPALLTSGKMSEREEFAFFLANKKNEQTRSKWAVMKEFSNNEARK